jgi:hypothetical protein
MVVSVVNLLIIVSCLGFIVVICEEISLILEAWIVCSCLSLAVYLASWVLSSVVCCDVWLESSVCTSSNRVNRTSMVSWGEYVSGILVSFWSMASFVYRLVLGHTRQNEQACGRKQ